MVLIGSFLVFGGCEREADPNPGALSLPVPNQPTDVPALDAPLSNFFGLIEDGRHGPARVRLRQWLDEHPEDSRGEFLMGLSYHQEKRYGRAIRWFDMAALHQPVYPPIWHFKGWSNYYMGNAPEALRAFEQHLRLDPNEGDSHFAIGLLAMEEWRLDEAERHFLKAIELQATESNRTKGVSKAKARLSEVVEHRDGDIDQATTSQGKRRAAPGSLRSLVSTVQTSHPAGTRRGGEISDGAVPHGEEAGSTMISTGHRAGVFILIVLSLASCKQAQEEPSPRVRFVDVTEGSGLDFTTTSGRQPSRQILEVNGGGIGPASITTTTVIRTCSSPMGQRWIHLMSDRGAVCFATRPNRVRSVSPM